MVTMQTFERNTTTSISSLIAILAIVAWIYGFYKVYQNYKQTQKKTSLYFASALLLGGLAIIFLALELITLQIFDLGTTVNQVYIGRDIMTGVNAGNVATLFSFIAVILSAFAILMFDTFSISFFENKMKFLVFPAMLIFIYITVYFYPNLPEIRLNETATDYNPFHDDTTSNILIILFLIPLFFPAFVFLLSAFQTRGNQYNFKRSLALAILSIMVAIGYAIEIIGGEDYYSIIGRIFILLYPFLTWNVLQGSKFVKRLLGAPT
jgi:hypothetical protein